jgi:hypothetical protein
MLGTQQSQRRNAQTIIKIIIKEMSYIVAKAHQQVFFLVSLT